MTSGVCEMAVGRWGLRTDKFKHQSSRVYLGGALKPSQMDDELNQDPLNQPQAHLLCPPDNIHMMNVPHFVVVVVVVTYSTDQWDVTVYNNCEQQTHPWEMENPSRSSYPGSQVGIKHNKAGGHPCTRWFAIPLRWRDAGPVGWHLECHSGK